MSTLKHAISAYKELSKFHVLSSAKFTVPESSKLINSIWTVNDVTLTKSKKIDISYFVDDNYNVLSQLPGVLRDDEVIFDVYSKCGQHRATCFERKLNESVGPESKGNIIYIWHNGDFVKSINLKELDVHGLIYKRDFNFGGLEWLLAGESIAYIAETKKPKQISHFQYQPQNKNDGNKGDQYRSKDDFGEQLEYVESPIICILDVVNEKVEMADTLPSDYVAGRFCVHPTKNAIVVTAYKKFPYQLGLIYCIQRCSDLFYYDHSSKDIKRIGCEEKSKMSPRFSLDGKHLIWLENDSSGPHMQCQRLMCYNWSTESVSIVVDIVRHSVDGFQGIYNLGVTDNCWHTDNRHVFLSSLDGLEHKIVAIDIESGLVKRFGSESDVINSVTLLDVNSQWMLVKVSSPSIVPYLAVADINSALIHGQLSIKPISNNHKIDNVSWHFINHTPTFIHPRYGANIFKSILISPRDIDKSPLILALHGGPHSAFSNEFMLFFAAAAQLGFSSLLVNYRGSWGCGQDSIDSLLGFIGEMDVSDCMKACEDVLEQYTSKLDAHNVFLYGGSHGGFLATHLAAKYAKRTRAMACRNPVINIPAMVTSTDIPDWAFTEAGLPWDHKSVLEDEQLLRMWRMSPLRYVDDIKCPVLVLIGQEDKRVPPSQGRELVRALLARAIPCEHHIYPKDSHPLASNEASADGFVNVLNWFGKYLAKE